MDISKKIKEILLENKMNISKLLTVFNSLALNYRENSDFINNTIINSLTSLDIIKTGLPRTKLSPDF